MTLNGFDVIGQEIFFDGWRVGALRRDILTSVHDRVVDALHQRDVEEHEKEIQDLRDEHEKDLEAARGQCESDELAAAKAEIATLRGIIHLMGGDLDA